MRVGERRIRGLSAKNAKKRQEMRGALVDAQFNLSFVFISVLSGLKLKRSI